ncbi:MAG: cytidylate kinase family protein [Burkholderiales bacterium]|nr:cytidylate kinase family protein [Burkholderiales bacterium]
MAIVAMGREMGSQGKAVADGVAAGLGAVVVHYEIIDHLADRSRIRKSHVARLLDTGDDLDRPLTPDDTLPTILSATEILEIAAIPESVVLRGWGGVALLREVPHVVRVRITAPLEVRVRNLMATVRRPDEKRIREEIRLFDEAHAAVMRRHFNVDYQDAALYDLVLDTSELPPDQCAQCIIDFTRDRRFIETRTSRLRLVGLTTAAHVRALLKLHPPTRDLRIEVAAHEGVVSLAGDVATAELRQRCEQVALRVPGITAVRNDLRVAA